jgi:hypothetical protein
MKIGTNQVLIVQDTGPAGGYGINDKYQQFITILKKDEMYNCNLNQYILNEMLPIFFNRFTR